MTSPLPKRYGKQMPLIIDIDERICFRMEMPDILEYRAALMGQLTDLGYWFSWDHTQADYSNIPVKNKAVAELWVQIVADASFEVCMDFCAQMIACINDNAGVQSALVNMLLSDPTFLQQITDAARIGVPLSGAQLDASLTTSCVEDNLFGGITSIVETMNRVNEDLFQIIEVGTNEEEQMALFLNAVPIFETLPAGEIIEGVQGLIEQITENYIAVYTQALENIYRCELFCIALEKPDCALTYQDIFDYFNDRVGAGFTNETLFYDIVEFLTLGSWSGTQIVDVMMMLQAGAWRWAGQFLDINLQSLMVVTQMGQNDPDHDWAIIPCNCEPPPLEECFDFVGSEAGWSAWLHPISGAPAAIHNSEGWDTGYNAGFAAIIKDIDATVTKVTIRLAEPTPTTTNVLIQVANLDLSGMLSNNTQDLSEYVFTGVSFSAGLYVNVQTDAAWTSSQRIIEICLEYAAP